MRVPLRALSEINVKKITSPLQGHPLWARRGKREKKSFWVKYTSAKFDPISAGLGHCEENTKLAAALDQLADVYLKVEKIHEEQAKVRRTLSL